MKPKARFFRFSGTALISLAASSLLLTGTATADTFSSGSIWTNVNATDIGVNPSTVGYWLPTNVGNLNGITLVPATTNPTFGTASGTVYLQNLIAPSRGGVNQTAYVTVIDTTTNTVVGSSTNSVSNNGVAVNTIVTPWRFNSLPLVASRRYALVFTSTAGTPGTAVTVVPADGGIYTGTIATGLTIATYGLAGGENSATEPAPGSGILNTAGGFPNYDQWFTATFTTSSDPLSTQTVASGTANLASGSYTGIRKTGTGTLNFDSASAYTVSSDIVVEEGIVRLTPAADSTTQTLLGGTSQITLNNVGLQGTGNQLVGTTLDIDTTAGAATLNNIVEGVGGLSRSAGSNVLTVATPQNYYGYTRIQSGLFTAGADNVFSPKSHVDVSGSCWLDLNNHSQTIGGLSGTGDVNLGTGNLTISQLSNQPTAPLAFNGSITGDGGLIKSGTGVTIIGGTNSYLGVTTISAGTLQFGRITSLYGYDTSAWTDTNLIVNSGATASFNFGGSGEFTDTDIQFLAALGTATGGFRSGSSLGLDTTNAGGTATYANAITNPNGGANTLGFVKQGSGILLLSGTNTYTGTTTVTGGTLRLGTTASFNGGILAINSGTFDLNGNSITTTQLTGSGTFALGTATGTVNQTTTTTFSGPITGAGTFVKSGSGTLTLSGASTLSGPVNINAGILKLGLAGPGTGGASGPLGPLNTAVTKVVVASGATLDVAGFHDTNYGVTISGSGTSGQGALINTGAATGSNNIQFPNIKLAANATIGGTANFYEIGNGYGANTLDLGGFTLTKAGANTFFLANTTITAGNVNVTAGTFSQFKASNGSAAAFTLSNTAGVSLALNALNLSVGSLAGGGTTGGGTTLGAGILTVGALNTSTSYAGVISGTGGVTKTGTGTLTLSGVSTYTGATTVTGGALIVGNGTTGSATASAFTVSGTGTVGGAGSIGALTVNSGGAVAPGNAGVGTLTSNAALTLASGGKVTWQVSDWNGAAGTGYDTVNAATLVIGSAPGTPATVVISPASLVNFNETNKTFTLVTTTGGITGLDAGDFTVDATGFSGTGTWAVQATGNVLQLVYTAGSADPFTTWATLHGLSGGNAARDADPDGDGIKNVLEFLFGTEPNPANAGSNSAAAAPTVTTDATTMTFSYRRASGTSSAGGVVQFSPTLSGWIAAIGQSGVTETVDSNHFGGGVDRVNVHIPKGTNTKLFARLYVAP